MPTLEWIGKDKVINHHQAVPYRVLKRVYSFDEQGQHEEDNGSRNMIIHGDNLEALKSLLPRYEGKVKCIYIDPPYNTGNEGWVYNDNVNDPKIKKWLGEVVGKEGEDLSRHDKWLCMMYPRLVLLHKLLADDGGIFISIDDNENANLRLICDEIFGVGNFVATIPWRKRTAKADVPYGLSQDYECILCYAKTKQFACKIQGKERKYFETPDYPNRPWRYHDLTKQTTVEERPNSGFTIVNPKTGEKFPANPIRSWAITADTFKDYYEQGRIIFPGDYDFLRIKKPVLRYWKEEDERKAGGNFGMISASTHIAEFVGMTQDGTKEITALFGNKKFPFPKPESLIRYLVGIATQGKDGAIVLDSFAGSGTTAHAVLKLNQTRAEKCRFILVELEDYANEITAERAKKVVMGYGKGNDIVDGTGGSFSFYELGERLLTDEENLNETVELEQIRAYVWFLETRSDLPLVGNGNPYFLGTNNGTAYYFYYEPSKVTVLNHDFLATIPEKKEITVIYADRCTLSESTLIKYGIVFKKIPRDITKL